MAGRRVTGDEKIITYPHGPREHTNTHTQTGLTARLRQTTQVGDEVTEGGVRVAAELLAPGDLGDELADDGRFQKHQRRLVDRGGNKNSQRRHRNGGGTGTQR